MACGFHGRDESMKLIFCYAAITALVSGQAIKGVSLNGIPNQSVGSSVLPVVNLGVQPGVDCTGANDSSSGINTAFSSLTGTKVVIPVGCTLRVNSQISISGQTNFEIEGEGFQPNQNSIGPYIYGCSGSAGPILYINRSSYYYIHNFGVYAKGDSCTSNFTGSMSWANSGSGGFTSTFSKIENMVFTTNRHGTMISGYFGFGVGVDGTGSGEAGPNLEQFTFRDNYIHCQSSPGSYGVWVFGDNADNGSAVNNRLSSCFQGIRIDAGNLKLIEKNHFDNAGSFSTFGTNGAAIYLSGCTSGGMSIIANESGDGGPFINTDNDIAGGGCPINLIGNYMGVSDLGPSAYPINLGVYSSGGIYTLIGNQLFMTASTTATAIGSSAQMNCGFGPLGSLVDIDNIINDLTKVGGWSGCLDGATLRSFQHGEYHQNSPLGTKAIVSESLTPTSIADPFVYAYPDVSSTTPDCDKIGRTWFNTTTTTTVMSVCLNVAGTPTWVTK